MTYRVSLEPEDVEAVAADLAAHGWTVVPMPGCGRVRVDLNGWSLDDLRRLMGAWQRHYCREYREGSHGLLYADGSRIRYRSESCELWQGPTALQERGWGDCDDLAPRRVAELRALGTRALLGLLGTLEWTGEPGPIRARTILEETGPTSGHVLVQFITPDGVLHQEDPSALLGMGDTMTVRSGDIITRAGASMPERAFAETANKALELSERASYGRKHRRMGRRSGPVNARPRERHNVAILREGRAFVVAAVPEGAGTEADILEAFQESRDGLREASALLEREGSLPEPAKSFRTVRLGDDLAIDIPTNVDLAAREIAPGVYAGVIVPRKEGTGFIDMASGAMDAIGQSSAAMWGAIPQLVQLAIISGKVNKGQLPAEALLQLVNGGGAAEVATPEGRMPAPAPGPPPGAPPQAWWMPPPQYVPQQWWGQGQYPPSPPMYAGPPPPSPYYGPTAPPGTVPTVPMMAGTGCDTGPADTTERPGGMGCDACEEPNWR